MSQENLRLDDVEDDEVLGQRIAGYYHSDCQHRQHLFRRWEEVIRFLEGEHWFHASSAVTRGDDGGIRPPLFGTRTMPRPRANHMFRIIRSIASAMVKNLPQANVRPRKARDERMRTASRVAEAVREALWERLREDERYGSIAIWLSSVGFCFKKSYVVETVGDRLAATSLVETTPDGQPLTELDGTPVEREITDVTPLMSLRSEVTTPLQLAWDPYANDFDESDWVIEWSVRPLAWVQENYDRDEEGYTGEAKDVKGGGTLSIPLRILRSLRAPFGTSQGDSIGEDEVVLLEWYKKPSKKFPRGRLVVATDTGKVLYKGDSPYQQGTRPDPQLWHPYTLVGYMPSIGRSAPLGVGEQLVPLQRKLNSIDAFWMLYRKTGLAPKVIVGKGSGIPRNHLVGAPTQWVEVNLSAGQPSVLHPARIGTEIDLERKTTLQDMNEIAGTFELLNGSRPEGVPSYSGLALLLETGNQALAIVFNGLEKAIERDETKKLKMVALFYERDDEAFTELVNHYLAKAHQIEVDTFVGADLLDNVDVRIEAGAAVPQSRVLLQQMTLEFLKMGLLTQALQDPQMRQQLFELFGMGDFAPVDSEDVKKAEAENAFMDQGGDADQVFLETENHFIHTKAHGDRMKRLDFFELDPAVRSNHVRHYQNHVRAMQAQQMQQATSAMTDQASAQQEAGQGFMGSRGQFRPAGMATGAMRGAEPGMGAGGPPSA